MKLAAGRKEHTTEGFVVYAGGMEKSGAGTVTDLLSKHFPKSTIMEVGTIEVEKLRRPWMRG